MRNSTEGAHRTSPPTSRSPSPASQKRFRTDHDREDQVEALEQVEVLERVVAGRSTSPQVETYSNTYREGRHQTADENETSRPVEEDSVQVSLQPSPLVPEPFPVPATVKADIMALVFQPYRNTSLAVLA